MIAGSYTMTSNVHMLSVMKQETEPVIAIGPGGTDGPGWITLREGRREAQKGEAHKCDVGPPHVPRRRGIGGRRHKPPHGAPGRHSSTNRWGHTGSPAGRSTGTPARRRSGACSSSGT